ncbi:LysR substrate-binding domain-containing protein [Sphingomonas sp.]|uniref:LysR substrate-binding domain-containing protein n=1 Tax=Sphingomonas sp. TaxID=28214 RepID=UPI0035BBF8A4
MKLSQIRDILAVAEHGSLRAAARQLDVAQPAITRSIRELEDELGATLFERHARGVRLTDMGKAFVRRATTVEAELRRAREEIAQLRGRHRGEVSVALSSAPSVTLLPTAFAAFRRHYPDVVLKLSENFFPAIQADLASGRLDFYVGPVEAPMAQPQFAMDPLYENTRVGLARKGHPLIARRSLAELVDAQWVRVTMSAGGNDSAFEAMFAMHGLAAPQVALHARSNLLALLAVANSDLLAIVPQPWLALPTMAGLFDPIVLDAPLPASPIFLVRRHDMPLTPVAEHFSDLIRRAALNHGRHGV